MNRLWVRLALAFVVVTCVGAGTIAAFADWSAGNQFRQYLARPEVFAEGGLLNSLEDFYGQHGSWDHIDEAITPPGPPNGRGGGQPSRFRPPVLLADANGLVVYDERHFRQGQTLNSAERNTALPVVVNSRVEGYLLGGPPQSAVPPPAQVFLDQLRNSLVIAAVVAGGVGLLLGVIISRALASPLAALANAARAFAAHNWEQRVPVDSRTQIVEVQAVAHAFNDMADSLQKAEIVRRNLMADVAHELRTPLTVLQGNLRALLDGVYPLELKEIATLYDETRLLSRLVDDLRELALAENGQLPFKAQPVDIRLLLGATATQFATAADAHGITVQVAAPDALPPIHTDADRVTQIMQNLMSNALRHTPEGGQITLSAAAQDSTIQISVSDTGEGIAADDMPYVFERFYRGDKSRTRRSGGTGLGLAIAKTLVSAMGGSIGVDSAPGKGSRFWFTLPTTI